MKCPDCKGLGFHTGFGCPGFKPMKINCGICEGAGELPENIIYDPEKGKVMKEDRKTARETLKERSLKTGINVVTLSERERGFFREVNNEQK